MKIKIKDIEKKLDYKIKKDFCSIGFDTAATTGVVTLKTDKEFLYIDSIVLSFKTLDEKERYNSIIKTFEKMIEEGMFGVIEDVFVGPNPHGALVLARLGGFAISSFVRKNLDYEIIGASTARSKFKINTKVFGKGKSKQAVKSWVDNLGVDLKDENIIDAFILALCGICEGIDFRTQKEIKEKK